MRQACKWFPLLLKAQQKRPENWIACLAMIAVMFVIASLKLPDGANFGVGIYCEKPEYATEMQTLLNQNETVYDFKVYDSKERMKEEILNGTIECGFDIDASFKEKFAGKNQKDVITYYCSSYTTRGEVAKETLYVTLLKMQSEIFLQVAAPEIYEKPDAQLIEELQKQQEYYESSDALLAVRSEVIGDPDPETPKKYSAYQELHPYMGSLAILLFLVIFLSVGDTLAKEKSGFPICLTAHERFIYACTKAFAAATVPGIVAFILACIFGEGNRNPFWILLKLLLLLLVAFVFCYALARILRRENRYMASLLALLLAIAVMTTAYFDLSIMLPVIGILRWLLPVSYFLL